MSLLTKMYSGRTQFGGTRGLKGYHMIVISTGLAVVGGYACIWLTVSVDGRERIAQNIGLFGEYAQDVTQIGHPPLNLNLPPHLRTDMKSYLDLPETVIRPPPPWDDLHPYLQYRLEDLMLSPDYSEFSYDAHMPGWVPVSPWGTIPSELTKSYVNADYNRRCAASNLHSQGKSRIIKPGSQRATPAAADAQSA
eukprot:TRINITY_DN77035_c0_g1_i1.p1 TRINITY_DN77035_c0_g1~~TRINITY_DN77035_c0_g1_i1.p1  ORF type:complete len:194 (+),score=34.07 TRINITY_DN77035_c0_g1_i1:89-670(+)